MRIPPGVALRSLVIGLTAFLTVVDLFATQAILPSLTRHYGVTPAAMGFAVNASTIGMAVAGLVVGFFSPHIDRRTGILLSLLLLAIPTSLLATAPNLAVFTVLRVAQGLCMASAFALTLAYLGEQCSAMDAGGAFAAYITGNVASNLVGRLVSAAVADSLGLAANFYFFAAAQSRRRRAGLFHHQARPADACDDAGDASPLRRDVAHWRDPALRAAFGIGFCILFAFIGTFTFVNFVLVRPPLSLGMMDLGFVYFVFLPSVVTTLLAGKAVARFGTRPTIWGSLAVAGARPAADADVAPCARCSPAWCWSASAPSSRRPRDRLRRAGRDRQPRRRQRHLSRLLFLRRARRQRRPRPVVRRVRLAGLRGRRGRGPRGSRPC